jgi:hypothetical protein
VLGEWRDRTFIGPAVQVLNSTSAVGQTSLSIAAAVPLNARWYGGYISVLSTATVVMIINLWTSGTPSSGILTHPFDLYCLSNVASVVPYNGAIVKNQSIGYSTIIGGGAVTFNINVNSYTI